MIVIPSYEAVEHAVLDCIFTAEKAEEALPKALVLMGKGLALDRILVLEALGDSPCFETTFVWERNTPLSDSLCFTPKPQLCSPPAALSFCSDVSTLPPLQRTFYAQQGVKALLCCPFPDGDATQGFFIFGDTHADGTGWSSRPQTVEAVRALSRPLCLYACKERYRLRLQEEQAALRQMTTNYLAAKKAKKAFLSGISHDMKTPLHGILGLCSLMLEQATEPTLYNDLLQIKGSGEYLLKLITDALDASQIESGQLTLHPCLCDASQIPQNIQTLTAPMLTEKNICLNLHSDPFPHSMLYLDMGRVMQIFLSILSNAIQFSKPNSHIDCSINLLCMEHNMLSIRATVQDYGIGMSQEFLQHIFEPFSQENPSASCYRASGLGMLIAKALIEQMCGSIQVESEQNCGTTVTFTIQLPVAVQAQDPCCAPCEMRPTLEGIHVLLCEDHTLNIAILSRLLEDRGVTVTVAKNGKLGYEAFLRAPPGTYRMIFMDIRMPVMDGLTATRAIRSAEHPQANSIPIVAITANTLPETAEEGRLAGMTAFLPKPIRPEQLYRTMESLLHIEETDRS